MFLLQGRTPEPCTFEEFVFITRLPAFYFLRSVEAAGEQILNRQRFGALSAYKQSINEVNQLVPHAGGAPNL